MGAWERMPKKGFLIAIRYNEPPYRDQLKGGDWYWWWDCVTTHEEWGKWADPPEGIDPKMLKQGEGIPDEEWEPVYAEAMAAKVW
jgi:hypothetical protein